MAGRRVVREWNPISDVKRTWHETLDHNGSIRVVRPERNNGEKIHYLFDDDGVFEGVR
ncbi:MAG: citrate synthase [Verrucomicrobia bacterium]|nr:citrate synthase [Verrucomicrobiota bacterium]